MLVLMAWVELGMTLLTQSVLDAATLRTARSVKIGATTTSLDFQTKLCGFLYGLIPCSSITFTVQSASSFSALSTTVATDGNGLTNTSFSIGSGRSDVLVQVGFSRALFTPLLSNLFGKNGKLLILSTVTFQNEPYS